MQQINNAIRRNPKDYIIESFQFYKQKSSIAVACIFIVLIAISMGSLYLENLCIDTYTTPLQGVDFQNTTQLTNALNKVQEGIIANPTALIYLVAFAIVGFFLTVFCIYTYNVLTLKSYSNPLVIEEKVNYFTFGKLVKFLIAYVLYTLLFTVAQAFFYFPIYFVMLYLIMYAPFIIDRNDGIFRSFGSSKRYMKMGGVLYARTIMYFFTIQLLAYIFSFVMTMVISNTYVINFIIYFINTVITLASIKIATLLYYDIKLVESHAGSEEEIEIEQEEENV